MKVPFNIPYEVSTLDFSGIEKYSGAGRFTKSCELKIGHLIGSKNVLLMPSCTAGLELSCMLLNLQEGDEVILPSYTFVSSANAIALRGAIPIFCDINEETFNIDEKKIEALVTENTKAIMPVHYAGQSCAMDEICSIASKYNLAIIEDAAQALGSFYKDRALGSIGDFGCFSFHETKNVHCGEGGAISINNPTFASRAEVLREKGTNRTAFQRKEVELYTWQDIGSSFLMSELQAYFLESQLENLNLVNEKRVNDFNYYHNKLLDLETRGYIKVLKIKECNRINGHIFAFLVESKQVREMIINYLQECGIGACFHYIPLHNAPMGQKFSRVTNEQLQTTINVSERIVRLPMYFELTRPEQNYICNKVFEFFI